MIEICYQDEFLVAVNKPAGWLVHRSWLDRREKIVVMQTVRDMLGQHVFTVHRLDRPTSGVLLLALSAEVAHTLSGEFEQHRVKKTYHAVVRGYMDGDGTIDYALTQELDKIADKFAQPDKAPQPAISHYRALAQVEMPVAIGRYPTSRYSLMELTPQTGRKHQLRRHLSHVHHPLIGDSTHGDLRQNRGFARTFDCPRLMLHASRLELAHPVTGLPLVIDAKWDQTWQNLLGRFQWTGILPAYERVEFAAATGQDMATLTR
ncbi:tRNA pseudouridine(65) synthase TruC [Sodalis sp. dw_96]|uniref:tRNA pseudouridine(65) synthase TruC n=1 Tax=Sodalis sp. dw_96 TaxID=2719794 RepID=UPI001BD41242|nr:tRNA pseudouridine(65) synthase TruC [Sodalis sp. dw_96]